MDKKRYSLLIFFFLFSTVNIHSQEFDYKVPSHEWKNNIQPWIDLAKVTSDNGLIGEPSNTSTAYADFNYDGYIDIMMALSTEDGTYLDYSFLINDGNNNYILDNSIIFEKTIESYTARKTIVGDFNGDNKPDLVRPQGGHGWLGKPTITISTENGFVLKEIEDAPLGQFHTVSSGDIDNDGDLDLFFAHNAHLDGFAINDGNGNFTWKPIIEIISNFSMTDNDGTHGLEGIWTSEMYDVNKDGNIDLVVAGSYIKESYDNKISGPTIFWGNGTGLFDYNTSTSIYVSRDLDISNDNRVVVTNDIVFNDVDGDGFVEFVSSSVLESGHTYIQIFKGLEDYSFENKTQDWLTDNLLIEGTTWIFLRDVDNNGFIDIVESETFVSRNDGNYGPSIRWEWNGSSFTTVIDTDGDGIKDDVDTCSDSPRGETVNSTGCSSVQLSVDDEILNNSLKLYPNPVTNILTIESKNVAISKVEIYSILGEKIKEINSIFGSITTDNLPNGMYLIKIYSEKGMVMKKTIKM